MKKLIVTIVLAAFGAVSSFGQSYSGKTFLDPLQPRDSVLIGDQFVYGVHLKEVPSGTVLVPADFSKGFMPGDSVEIVRPWVADTVKVHGPKKAPSSRDIDLSLIITSFEEGKHVLPPLPVLRQSLSGEVDTLVFEPETLEVFTIPVDTTTYVIHDIKGQIRYPLTLSEILPYVAVVWLSALVGILIWALLSSRRKKDVKENAYKDPPYIVALRKLEGLRSEKNWVKERQKSFYSGITDALREYIDARYGIDAPEMTTAELFDSLKMTDVPADLFMEMKGLFERADLVKFAKAFASDEDNASAVPSAVRFVTATYQTAAPSQAPEPAEGDVEPERTSGPGRVHSRFAAAENGLSPESAPAGASPEDDSRFAAAENGLSPESAPAGASPEDDSRFAAAGDPVGDLAESGDSADGNKTGGTE